MPYTEAEEAIIAKNLARTDVRISQVTAAIMVPGLLFLPNDWIWYWLPPLFLLYARMHYIVMIREELLDESIRQRREAAAGSYRGERSVTIAQRPEQVRVARQ